MDQNNIYNQPVGDGSEETGVLNEPVVPQEASPVYSQPQYQPPVYNQPQQPQYQSPVYNQPQYQPPIYNQPQQPEYQPPVYNQPQQPQYQPPVYAQPQQPVGNPVLDSGPLLTFGILSVAFACSFYIAFLGIIFGFIQKNKLEAYLTAGGVYTGKAKVGGILAKIGRIVGIVMTAILSVYLTVIIFVGIL